MSLPVPTTTTTAQTIALDQREIQALDAPLIALTNQCGGDLRRLMFAFFSFLNRRTDFYLVPHPDDISQGKPIKMGFKEGDAEKLLLAAFRQFPLRRMPPAGDQMPAASSGSHGGDSPISSSTKKKLEHNSKKEEAGTLSTSTKPDSSSLSPTKNKQNVASTSDSKGCPNSYMGNVKYSEDGLQIPVGNGGSTKRYRWTQTIEECSIMIGIPIGTKGRDLNVSITPTSISVKSKKPLQTIATVDSTGTSGDGGDGKPHTFVEGKLVEKIRADESTWTLEGSVLVVTLDKLKKTFWDTVIEGDEKIDTDLIDSKRHISEYDDATQGQIRKIIFDQNQERRGLETSDDILGKKPEICERAGRVRQ